MGSPARRYQHHTGSTGVELSAARQRQPFGRQRLDGAVGQTGHRHAGGKPYPTPRLPPMAHRALNVHLRGGSGRARGEMRGPLPPAMSRSRRQPRVDSTPHADTVVRCAGGHHPPTVAGGRSYQTRARTACRADHRRHHAPRTARSRGQTTWIPLTVEAGLQQSAAAGSWSVGLFGAAVAGLSDRQYTVARRLADRPARNPAAPAVA